MFMVLIVTLVARYIDNYIWHSYHFPVIYLARSYFNISTQALVFIGLGLLPISRKLVKQTEQGNFIGMVELLPENLKPNLRWKSVII